MPKIKRVFNNDERFTELGFAIAYYRKRRGISQDQLAEQVGISRQHMGAVEAPNMNRGISLELLFNIAAVLKVEPYMLLKFNPDKPDA